MWTVIFAIVAVLLRVEVGAQTPTPVPLCGAGPQSGCKAPLFPAEGQLIVKNSTPDQRDQLRWEWWEGESTTAEDFGDPTTTTEYAVCVWDHVGGVPVLVWSAAIPGGGTCAGRPCWKQNAVAYVYKDRFAERHGIRRMRLRSGPDGEARITVSGKKANLQPVTPLAQEAMVIVQLVNSIGNCWEARYTSPSDNTAFKFRDVND